MAAPTHLLIVDDHPDTLRVMQRLLERAGFAVTAVSNINDAKSAAATQHFDLLISDLSYWTNTQNAMTFEMVRTLNQIGGPVDPNEWYMSPQTVNAYYDPSVNNINFPAGILQPPFFAESATDAENFGAIGMVIGHEMTHGFDTSGSQFDGHGLCEALHGVLGGTVDRAVGGTDMTHLR